MDGQAFFPGEFDQGIFRPTFLGGGGADGDNVFAAFQEFLEDSFAESLLTVNNNTHLTTPQGALQCAVKLTGLFRCVGANFADGTGTDDSLEVVATVPKHVGQNFLRVLAKQR